jgi:antitoxin ParD1/3/4
MISRGYTGSAAEFRLWRTEDAGKLKALRAAARVGVGALDRGDFKEFESLGDLQAYLNDLSEKVIGKAAE